MKMIIEFSSIHCESKSPEPRNHNDQITIFNVQTIS